MNIYFKTLSIKNPWAYLIARGWKDVENRTWRTHHRGKVLIHISKKIDPIVKTLFFKDRYRLTDEQFEEIIFNVNTVGCIIGEVDIVDVVEDHPSIWSAEGQWQWVLKNPVLYNEPILNVQGALNIWNCNYPHVIGALKERFNY